MTPDAQAICAELRAEIVRAGWSQTARRCSIDRTTLHRDFPDKPGGRTPSFKTVTKVAAVFGMRIALLPASGSEA